MTDAPDAKLLEQFALDNSEAAFAVLVERHVALVHSVAVRHSANPQSAQDITQAVFIILARKAGSLNRKTVLPGWLYHAARLTAANFQRAEMHRIQREQEAYMRSTLQESAPDTPWSEMSPLLDEAMSHLGASDRDALVLRYFQNKSLSEVGIAMGLEERTAQKRVTRAVEKLRTFFAKRGVTLTAAAIAGAVSANSVQAAPVSLAATVTAAAKGAAVSASTLTLIKGALKIMAWTKMKTAIVVGVAVLLAAGTATVIVRKASESNSQTLTLKIDPEIFIGNLKARAAGTMHLPSDPWDEILLDVLKIARVDCTPPHDIALDTKNGTIAMNNTPEALKAFRQVVEGLDRPDGKTSWPPPNFDSKHTILIRSSFYKMRSSDFDQLNLGVPSSNGGTNNSPWWMLEPNALAKLKQHLKTAGLKSFQSPSIETSYGGRGDFFVGNSTQGKSVEFDFLPMCPSSAPFDKDMIELKAQVSTSGEFTSNPAGDWPDFAGRTNCAIFASTVVPNGGGFVFRAENPVDSITNDLVIISEVSVKSAAKK